ncbi:hypothetical protein N7474_002956 [Penicillium riverlandense]|uniref:uncharacterized protein n=1 Tax=Penicillium riverlandense TaxID=1903569 RepID=UPI002548635D|nr:uncharacterized protein N7474_002956 [Penicillium riverlandense]KAJ5825818.1 hypothetical protein N7474_002956 [Penicillium riverlandense]
MYSTFAEYSYCYTRSWLGPTPLSGFGCAPSPSKEDVLSGIINPSDTTASTTSSTFQTSSSATNATSAINTATPSAGTSTTPAGVSHHNPPPLSNGAIAGIAVGGFFFICILIALAVPKSRNWIFAVFRSHKSPTDSASEGAELRSNHEADPPSQRIRPPSVLSGPSVVPWDTGRYENY